MLATATVKTKPNPAKKKKTPTTVAITPERKAVADQLRSLRKQLKKEQKECAKAAERRARLGIGASRARTTTANGAWARKAEARDMTIDRIDSLRSFGKTLPRLTTSPS